MVENNKKNDDNSATRAKGLLVTCLTSQHTRFDQKAASKLARNYLFSLNAKKSSMIMLYEQTRTTLSVR